MSTSNSLRRFGFLPCRLLSATFLLGAFASAFGQSAPSFSYTTPQVLVKDSSITAITPNHVGGSVPVGTYQKVSTFAGSTSGWFDATSTSARFKQPTGMAIDGSGNLYVADCYNHRIRKVTPLGVVTTLAGDGYADYFTTYGRLQNGDGTAASFNYPTDIAIHPDGSCLYVADKENDVIRRISLTSPYAVTTFAGTGTAGFANNANGTLAQFSQPEGIAFDGSGSTHYLYVADRGNHRIRRIELSSTNGNATAGAVTTFAGSGTAGSLDATSAASATFNHPVQVAVSSDGTTLYVADLTSNKVRKIQSGSVSTLAGSGTLGGSDNPNGQLATFNAPYGIEIDYAGNIIVSEQGGHRLRMITTGGAVTTLSGTGSANSTEGVGLLAAFNTPSGMVFDAVRARLYVADHNNHRIRKMDLSGYAVSPALPNNLALDATTGIITGTPTGLSSATNYTVTAYNYYGTSTATLNLAVVKLPILTTTSVTSITLTGASTGGTISDNGGSPVTARGVVWNTKSGPTIALSTKTTDGSGSALPFTSTISGLNSATKYYVRAYATTAAGTAYGNEVSFTTLNAIPNISYSVTSIGFTVGTPVSGTLVINNTGGTPDPVQVTTLAGNCTSGSVDGTGKAARLYAPRGVALDGSGNLYFADAANHRIRKIVLSTGVVTTLAGSTNGYADGTGTNAKLYWPYGIALDGSGNLYFADQYNNCIRKLDLATLAVTTLAGPTSSIGSPSGYVDASGPSARFNNPTGIVLDGNGNLFVADNYNHRIRKVVIATGAVTTLAGPIAGTTNTWGWVDGPATNARFNKPIGIALGDSGKLYVTDSENHRIRVVRQDGTVSTFAGLAAASQTPYGHNDGIGSSARFYYPQFIAEDGSGNFYVSEENNKDLRKVSSTAMVSTWAGMVGNPGCVDGTGTVSVKFQLPSGIAVDASGNIYLADMNSHTIRIISRYRIDPALPAGLFFDARTGAISGTPTATSPQQTYTVYAQNSLGPVTTTINIAVSAVPTVTTGAATPVSSTTATLKGTVNANGSPTTALTIMYSTVKADVDAGNGTSATVSPTSAIGSANTPISAALTGLTPGTTYYYRISATNSAGSSVGSTMSFTTAPQKPVISYSGAASPVTLSMGTAMTPLSVTNTGGTIEPMQVTTLAGGSSGFLDGTGTTAKFRLPMGLAFDGTGNLYVADSMQGIRKVDINTRVVTTVAGSTSGFADATGLAAKFSGASGVTVDGSGNLYVADYYNNRIRKITPAGVVTTLAGGSISGSQNATIGTNATFNKPAGIAVDATGTHLYVADRLSHLIRKIVVSTGEVTTLAGSTFGFFDSTGTNAKLWSPAGVAVDGSGNLYVAEAANHRIRKIAISTGVVTTLAGSGNAAFADGTGTNASFFEPTGVALDGSGNLYIADPGNQRIRKLVISTGEVISLAGKDNGTFDGSGIAANFSKPTGIAIDGSGNLYVADAFNYRIRKISKFSIIPALPAGLSFNSATGEISGTPTAITPSKTYTVGTANAGGNASTTFTLSVGASMMTTAASAIGETTATTGGTVGSTYTGITERGVVWNTATGPTIANNKQAEGSTTTGAFTVNLTGLTPNTTYYIRSYVTYGSSVTEYGNEQTFKTNALGTFSNVNKTFGDAKFSLTAPTAVSTGAFSYGSSDPGVATVSGSEVTVTGAGTTTITATQAASGAYASVNKTMTLTVAKRTPTITLSIPTTTALNLVTGANTITVTGTSSDGQMVTMNIVAGGASGTLTDIGASGGDYTLSNVGSTGTITFEGAVSGDANNNAATKQAAMDVTKNNQSITFNALPAVTYSSGLTQTLSATTTATGLSVVFTVVSGPGSTGGTNGTTLTVTGPGSIVITASQAGDGTYNAAPDVTRTLTVNPAAPTITGFAPASATQGDVVTITGTNFQNVTAVSFGGTAATSFNVASATSITAVLGTGGSGLVSVTTTGGTDTEAGFRYKVTWTGATKDFATNTNWTGNRPPQMDDDIIFSPTAESDLELDGSKTVGHVDFNGSTRSLNLGAYNLTVKGNLTMPGNISGSGKVIMQGGSAQTIRGGGDIPDLEIDNANGVSIDAAGGELTVSGTLRPTSGTLTTNGKLRLKSNSGGTARVGPGSGSYISGNVIAERYIQQNSNASGTGRAWRLVSVPVTGTGTLRDFFMNGRSGQDLTLSASRDGEATNSGTPIVGHNHADASSATAAGFDWIGVANQVSSLRYYTGDAGGGSFASENVPTMSTTYTAANQGYMVFARGDRKLDFPNTTSSGSTTFRSTGSLKTGPQTVSVSPAATSKYTLVGNPYMSVLDLSAFYASNSTVINPSFWIWDANISGTQKQGAYVNVFLSGSEWVSYPATYDNPKLLESGMAFFVEPLSTLGSATNISILESHKSSAAAAGLSPFSTDKPDDHGRMYVRLERADEKGQRHIIDGVMADFHSSFKEALTDMSDREKLRNGISRGALWIPREGKVLSCEGLPWPTEVKRSIPLTMSGVGDQILLVHINPTGMRDRYVRAWLKDNVLKREVEIDMSQPTDYDFIGTGRSDWDSTRFEIVYVESGRPGTGVTLEPDSGTEQESIRVYPNPTKGSDLRMSLRQVEPGGYRVEVLDMSGRLVATRTLEHRTPNGEYRVLEGGRLSPGGYVLRLGRGDRLVGTWQVVIE